MTIPKIACIVEGHGEVEALPVLVRRILSEEGLYADIRKPHRMTSAAMRTPQITDVAQIHAAITEPSGGLIIAMFDLDDDNETSLRQDAEAHLTDYRHVVAVASHEYEAWILAGVHELGENYGVAPDATPHPDPESPRNAKKAVEEYIQRSYKETVDQAKLSAVINLDTVGQRSNTFRRFREDLVGALK